MCFANYAKGILADTRDFAVQRPKQNPSSFELGFVLNKTLAMTYSCMA